MRIEIRWAGYTATYDGRSWTGAETSGVMSYIGQIAGTIEAGGAQPVRAQYGAMLDRIRSIPAVEVLTAEWPPEDPEPDEDTTGIIH